MTYPTIGIIAITTPGGAICSQHLVKSASNFGLGSAHPEYFVHARSTADYIAAVNQENWLLVADMVMDSVHKLSKLGARLFIMPSNTPHYAWNFIEKELEILNRNKNAPTFFLNLITETVNFCQEKKYQSVLLLGTAQTMRGDLYKKQFYEKFITCYVPPEEEIIFLDNYIKTFLVKNISDKESTNRIIRAINKMSSENKFDAIILGCTELPMILYDESLRKRDDWNNDIHLVDTTYILAEKAMVKAIATHEELNSVDNQVGIKFK